WVQGVTFGADGKLYVGDDHRVRRYDAAGGYLDDFVPSPGPLEGAGRLRFGPDGNLYVPGNGDILRINGVTGAMTGSVQRATDVVFREDGKMLLDYTCSVNIYDPRVNSYPGWLI